MQTLWPLVGRFGEVAEREQISREIARAAGAERMILFIQDQDVGRYLPGPGFPQTLNRGWMQLVESAVQRGSVFGELSLEGEVWPARADFVGETVLVLLGGSPQPETLLVLVPLLGSLLRNEMVARQAQTHAQQAARSAEEAKDLAGNLDLARRELQLRLRQLSEAKALAEAANLSKSNFLANMSHEIRTPMAAIFGYVDILRRQSSDPDDLQCLEIIQRNGEHLLNIVNDILDLSKIEAGKLKVESLPLRFCSLVAEVVDLMQMRANERKLPITVEFHYPLPDTIHSDPVRLRQILVNLLGNAVKFTEAGQVKLQVRRLPEEDRLEIAVEDTGIGIAPDNLKNLFKPFQQADDSVTRKFGGTGLGLAITQHLVQLLGGQISATSVLGVGSRFVFQLPTGSLQDANWLLSDEQSKFNRSAALPSPDLSGLTVLAVDDRRDIRDLVRTYLEEAGASVYTAADGCLALEVLERESIDLVVLDMQMPRLDGYQTAREIRQRSYQMPILALTANAMKGDQDRCMEAGCSGYLSKPIDRQKLLLEVKAQTSRLQVLVVEDNPLAGSALAGMLRSLGCVVCLVQNGTQALEALKSFEPALALLDLGLPDMDGWELLSRFRQQCPQSRVVAHTGRQASELEPPVQGLAFDGYLLKPADRDGLLQCLFAHPLAY